MEGKEGKRIKGREGRHGGGREGKGRKEGRKEVHLLVREVFVPQVEILWFNAAGKCQLAFVFEFLCHSHAGHTVHTGQYARLSHSLRNITLDVAAGGFNFINLGLQVNQNLAHAQEEIAVGFSPPRRWSPVRAQHRNFCIWHHRNQLLATGLRPGQIRLLPICNYANAQFVVVFGQDILFVKGVKLLGRIFPCHHAQHGEATRVEIAELGHIVDVVVDADHHLVRTWTVVFCKTLADVLCELVCCEGFHLCAGLGMEGR
jgi:hypothetical protein